MNAEYFYDVLDEVPYEKPYCNKCEEKEERIDKAKYWLESLVEQIYSRDKLEVLNFENHLDELCHLLDVEMNAGDIMIERKRGG